MLKKITAFCFFLPIFLFSQENIFYHYGSDNGLSQESIQTLIKDSTGFIWVGTQEGLNRFDGHSFKIYKNDLENPNSLSGNDVEKLLEFGDYIFAGTKNNGICYYDKSLNVFFKTDIKEGTCTSIVKHNNKVYVAMLNDGLYEIEKIDSTLKTHKINALKNQTITSLYSSNDSTLFIGTITGKIYYTDAIDKLKFESIKIEDEKEPVNTFLVDGKSLWIGTNAGLFKYEFDGERVVKVKLTNSIIKINKILNYNTDYFIATNNGLYKVKNYDANLNTFSETTIFIGDKNNINSITSNRVYDILLYNNLLWAGTNKMDVLALKEPVFKSITIKSKPKISNNHIYSTLKTDTYLFVGTRNGLNCIDNQGKTTVITKSNSNLTGNVIRGITKDTNNNLWLATTKGLSVLSLTNFNPEKPKIIAIYHNPSNIKSLSNNNTRSVFIDNKDKVWVATYGGGINLFTGDLKTKKITFKQFQNSLDNNSLSSNFTFKINQSDDNAYWISTENGFNKLVFHDDELQNYTFTIYRKSSDANSIKSNGILTSHIDKNNKNILWIGTENGLHKFNINTNKFTYYGAKNGLTNLVVYGILEDSHSHLWVSTNSGLFRFDKEKEHFANYTTNDGLKNIEYNLGSEFYDKATQQLYFGGTKGLDYFSTDDLNSLYHEGNLFFTSLTIKEKEINPSENNKILTNSIVKSSEIHLNYNDFPAKLKFSDLYFDFPKSSEFVYKLLPNDAEWNPLKNQREIHLLNLNSGTYELQIQGKGKEKFWSKKPLKLLIVVSPPWYKSNLAYLFYTLLFLSSVFLLYKFQLKRSLELKESARLKELDELKTKLYSNITHEFRTPLTVILGITDSISENINATPNKIKSYLDMIKRNSNNLLQLVNQILDLSKIEKGKIELNLAEGDIVKHIKYLTESFSSYTEEKKISLIFYNEINKLIIPFDKDKCNKIISNLLSNAIKFSKENSKIVIYLKRKENNLIIQVKDYGVGISKDNLPFIFDRFYQADNNKNNTGTGIGLALTKELVELMNGTIEVESTENIETIFTIQLPIAQEIPLKTTEETKVENIDFLNDEKPIALIVEDNKDVRAYVKLCLENDYLVIEAKNGKEGIELAFEHTPDIIISDVMMPFVDGYELCKTLKEDIKTNHIPIILLTAKNSQESKIEGLIQGADAYLTKPFNKEELLIRIKKLIAIRELLQSKYKDISKINIEDESTDKNDVFLQRVLELISKNLDNSEYHANDLSKELNLSESQLYRKLKAITTYSTSLFIRKIRLQTAKNLLETTNKSISEICYETGFNNPSWFARIFKQEFGFSPSNQRK